jgi:hypothetical protein
MWGTCAARVLFLGLTSVGEPFTSKLRLLATRFLCTRCSVVLQPVQLVCQPAASLWLTVGFSLWSALLCAWRVRVLWAPLLLLCFTPHSKPPCVMLCAPAVAGTPESDLFFALTCLR